MSEEHREPPFELHRITPPPNFVYPKMKLGTALAVMLLLGIASWAVVIAAVVLIYRLVT